MSHEFLWEKEFQNDKRTASAKTLNCPIEGIPRRLTYLVWRKLGRSGK